MKWLVILASCWLLSCASSASRNSSGKHDDQFIQIFFHHGKANELDTFHGTYQKDLVSARGTATTAMWLTKRDQEIILSTLERFLFFSLPDTIPKQQGVVVTPDMGIQILKVKYGDITKTVVWYETNDPQYSSAKYSIEEIKNLIINIIYSTPEYKAMPPAEGLYL